MGARAATLGVSLDLERDRQNDSVVFIHSSFRASSTWLWSQFRRSNKAIAYYEIFHEGLAAIAKDRLDELTPHTWPSGHPKGPGYFLEFLPFIRDEGGVKGFEASMAFAGFIPEAGLCGALRDSERAYIASLIGYAQQEHKTPVLSDTRSLGRIRAIKAAFPGQHVLIYRNLFHQWCSYTEQLYLNNPYFFFTIRSTIWENQHDPFFKCLSDQFPLGAASPDSVEYFCCFVLLHLYLYAQIADAADLIIDINQLESNTDYRHNIEQQLADTSGIDIDLADVSNAIAFSVVPPSKSDQALDQIRIIGNLVIANAPTLQGRTFASKALDELIAECKRYHFYAGRLLENHGLLGEIDRLRAERDAFLASTSWRITAPLRALKNLYRQFVARPPYRQGTPKKS